MDLITSARTYKTREISEEEMTMTKRGLTLSLTPGKAIAEDSARVRATATGKPFGVWEHVGYYGRPSGDIPARHSFRVLPLDGPDPSDDWALVACIDPADLQAAMKAPEPKPELGLEDKIRIELSMLRGAYRRLQERAIQEVQDAMTRQNTQLGHNLGNIAHELSAMAGRIEQMEKLLRRSF